MFPTAATLKQNSVLGRLTVSNQTGNTDADAAFEEIHVFGARSFSIWKDDGTIVFDSGDDLEQLTASALSTPANTTPFNANNDSNASFDSRSDNKGPEPEGVALGEIGGKLYAFVGLERIGGVVVYDISNPSSPSFVQYLNNRNFAVSVTTAPGVANPLAGDLGPEGLVFVPASDSPIAGTALLIVGNEISGTTSVYAVIPEPGTALLLGLGTLALAAARRRSA